MRAVILAAGTGSRLGKASDGLPKCLLQIGGQPLIYHQLGVLAETGVSPVLVVVGYAADVVRETVGNRAEFILNPRYASTNSLYSLSLANEWAKGPLLILNSDVVFDPEILERLIKAGPDSIAYDSASGFASEHMKVQFTDGVLSHMSKDLPKEQANGENVGMIYLGEKSAALLFAKARGLIEAGGANSFLAEGVRALMKDVPLRGIDIAGLPWTEIDSPYDLDRARREIWPAIEHRSGSRIIGWKTRRRRRKFVNLVLVLSSLAVVFLAGWWIAATQPGVVWETANAQSGKQINLKVNGAAQVWWVAEGQSLVTSQISGPQRMRIDTRCLLPKDSQETIPYVFEVLIDQKLFDYYKFTATPDSRVPSPDGVVCDRDKIELDVPAGTHEIGVRLLAGKAKALMVRFRIVEE